MAVKSTKNKKNTRKKTTKPQENRELKEEIIILSVLAICILLVISNFGIGGIAGEGVSSVMFGLFGLVAYFLPFVLFGVVAFVISNKGNAHAYIKAGAIVAFLLLMSALLQLITTPFDSEAGLLSYYHLASENKSAGGLLGGCIIKVLCPFIGIVGTYVVLIVLAIISIILITEKSLLAPLSRQSKKAYTDARQRTAASMQRRAARQQERALTQKNITESKKVSGVSFATTLTSGGSRIGKPAKSPELKELVPPEELAETAPIPSPFEDLVINRPEGPAVEESLTEDVPVKEELIKKRRTQESAKETAKETAQVEKAISEQEEKPQRTYKIPPLNLLTKGKKTSGDTDAHLRATAMKLEETLQNFGVQVRVTNASCGPSVTRYEIQPEQGVKVSKIVGLADDIKLNLAVTDLRIEAPIPGKAAVGIEVPNSENTAVMLRDLLDTKEFQDNHSRIPFAVGKDISGKVMVADIAKMPHLLVAGATGSGKSVCINTLIMSIIYKANPDDVKLIMVDPKVVELSVYNGIPHLLIPVVTDPKKAAGALNWAVAEMEKRYKLFAEYNVRDLKGFNDKISQMPPEEGMPAKMPQIVIIVDELADLMMVAPGEVEGAICRLAQLARAAGLHLILATQRPSVNVITGLIKANMPSRIAFSVSSGVDSRTIIDMNGAEKLLGKGDMLFYPSGYPKPVRVQGSFVSDKEVQKVVDYLIAQNGSVSYSEEIEERVNANTAATGEITSAQASESNNARDAYFIEAGKLIIDKDKASIGMLQRMFKIGFNRAARIMDQLAEAGIVGPEEGTKPRKILMTEEEFQQYLEEDAQK